ncbi:hypothetical protein [Conexibacter sp. SYSU D00693]|uniref:hypothetical protein n=1 Tax=Conexibacter sp. SYSU D00693 TaxID=2812560 RepID=UPI00196AF840|nr:hypothetical protein [Conexibacter sp. SYSU D00693]
MTALRNIVNDLVEKKLWPIAVLLVVALVAMPVLLRGGDEPTAAVPPPAAATVDDDALATAGAAGGVQVTLEGDAKVKSTRKGRLRDPFVQQGGDAPADDAAGSTAGTAAGAGAATGAGAAAGAGATAGATPSIPELPSSGDGAGSGDSGASTGSDSAPSPPSTPSTPSSSGDDEDDRADVVLRWGERGGELKRIEDPSRLRAIPNSGFPLVVYAGKRSDGKAVRFVVNALTHVSNDGRCRPDRSNCRTLEVREGGTAIIEIARSSTETESYRLEVVRIGKSG